jgi:tripartite-type tricarboxylate transporter receptor subunit TctC
MNTPVLPGRRRVLAGAALLWSAWVPARAWAGGDPISLIVGFPPGGPNDLIARLLAPLLSQQLQRSVIVENRSGADGEMGAAAVARSAPDGRMLLFASAGAMSISPAIKKQLSYDPVRDFVPIARVASSPMALVARSQAGYGNAEEVIAAARRKPGGVSFASAGVGSPTHLAGALFCQLAKVDMLHVPYRGGGPALSDLLGGQVDLYFAGVSTALPLIRSGQLKALGVTSKAPLAAMPGVPALAETPQLKGYEVDNWYGVLAPAGTARDESARLADALQACVENSALSARLLDQGVLPALLREQKFGDLIAGDLKKWRAIAPTLHLPDA